ncbi:MAG: DUF433 domain-containing protein, partial [Pirellulales bacterium]
FTWGVYRHSVSTWVHKSDCCQSLRHEEEMAGRLSVAMRLLGNSVEIDPDVHSGLPVVRGTRVAVSRIFAEIADDYRLSEIADNFEIDHELLKNLVEGVSIRLDQPFAE